MSYWLIVLAARRLNEGLLKKVRNSRTGTVNVYIYVRLLVTETLVVALSMRRKAIVKQESV